MFFLSLQKVKTVASGGGITVTTIQRGCDITGCVEGDGDFTKDGIKGTIQARCCSGKLCNGAVSVSPVSTLIMFWCLGLVTLSYQ